MLVCMHERGCVFVCVVCVCLLVLCVYLLVLCVCVVCVCLYHGVHQSHACTMVFIRAMSVPWCSS